MTKAKFDSTIGWRGTVPAAVLTSLVAVGMVPIVRASEIGAAEHPPIYRNITSAAMLALVPQAH